MTPGFTQLGCQLDMKMGRDSNHRCAETTLDSLVEVCVGLLYAVAIGDRLTQRIFEFAQCHLSTIGGLKAANVPLTDRADPDDQNSVDRRLSLVSRESVKDPRLPGMVIEEGTLRATPLLLLHPPRGI